MSDLADDILDMELRIANASLMIGDYADMIVEVEEMGLQMVEDVCSSVQLSARVRSFSQPRFPRLEARSNKKKERNL